jgi:hypothetical protein
MTAHHTTQHTQVRNQNHGAQRDNHGRRDPRSFDAGTHHRVEERRYRDGHWNVRFEGYWFECSVWPAWALYEDVYFVEGPNGVFFVYEYNNPAMFLQVYLVD